MFKNWFTTLAGIMAGLGTLPMMAGASHVAIPLWWNNCQFPLILVGAIGVIMLGVAAKGADEHSTQNEVAVSSVEATVAQVKKADEAAKV
jgi:hypothetical protein